MPRPDSVHIDPGGGLRLPVEGHVADGDGAAGPRAEPQQFVFDAEAGQPVAEVADGFVVVEIRLADPTFGPRTAHHETAAAIGHDGETALVDRDRPDDGATGHDGRLRVAIRRDHVPQRERQRPQPFPTDRGHLVYRPAEPTGDLLTDELGQLTRLRHVDLVEHHSPRALG